MVNGSQKTSGQEFVKPKKRRTRSPHPGVLLLRPRGSQVSWRAQYKDPDAQKLVWVSLPPEITTLEQRRQWAILKSQDISRRDQDLSSGAIRLTGRSLSSALAEYERGNSHLSDRTLVIARSVLKRFEAFAKKERVRTCDDVTRPFLIRFKAHLVAQPKLKAKPGGTRGSFELSNEPRDVVSVNHDLMAIRAILGYLCDLDLFPKLHHDDLRRALKRLTVPEKRIKFLSPQECKTLLEVALSHDAETFAETREEHIGAAEKGTTPRHPPIVAFAAFVLLTGARRGEAVNLEWSEVDLASKEIHLEGTATKTRKRRTIDLTVCPMLHGLLSVLHDRGGRPKSGSAFNLTEANTTDAVERLKALGAPNQFTWKVLRSTCGTFLTNSPGIFAGASAYRSARQLGHSVAVAEKHYLGLIKNINPEAKTLEAAMGIEDVMFDLTLSLQ